MDFGRLLVFDSKTAFLYICQIEFCTHLFEFKYMFSRVLVPFKWVN